MIPTHPLPTPEGIERLTRIATSRLDTGEDHATLLGWLRSASTADMFGKTAAQAVAVLFAGGGAR